MARVERKHGYTVVFRPATPEELRFWNSLQQTDLGGCLTEKGLRFNKMEDDPEPLTVEEFKLLLKIKAGQKPQTHFEGNGQ